MSEKESLDREILGNLQEFVVAMDVREDSHVDGDDREDDTGQSHSGKLVHKLNSHVDNETYEGAGGNWRVSENNLRDRPTGRDVAYP